MLLRLLKFGLRHLAHPPLAYLHLLHPSSRSLRSLPRSSIELGGALGFVADLMKSDL
jgi:hypothetical protein